MAAAAAAAASSPSDGDVQPCKKRKEDDPPIKAITKYFSPLGKNVDRLASPPKPNNIMDYFKKTSLTNEKIVSPVTEKESKTTSLSLENSSKSSSRLKRRGKRCNLTNTLTDVKTLDVVIEINSDDSREILSPEEKDSKASSISPNVSTLPGPPNVEEMLNGCSKNPLNIVGFKSQEGKIKMEGDKIKANVKRSKKRKHKDESDLPACFVIETQQKDLYKVVDDKQVVNEYENESLVNMQDHDTSAHETPHLNDNTVTISFEDFLKSQGENNVDHIAKAQTLDNSIACDETDRYQEVQQLPLKKVTVLAQIHSVPPKSPSSQKIASIFLKQKPKKVKRQSSPSASEGEVTEHMTQKRKSNVVIAEEELELAILETSGSEAVKSKCTAEERYQFMKAFKQPESETVKTGVKKGPGKQKEAGGKSLKHKLELEECEDVSNEKLEHEVSTVYTNCSSHDEDNKNDSGRVRTDKLKRKKKIQKTKEKDLNMNNNQNSEVNDQIKAETSKEIQSELPQKNKGLRRSPRQKKGKDAIQCTPEKAEITEAVTESTPPAIPLQASTPKTNNRMLSKSDLYKAEMITESLDSKSPIRMKFTRISIAERFMQQNIKVNTNSNNISKAKKLVEKAKVLQHNRKTRIVEDTLHTPLRRSSRQQAIADRKRSRNMEDSVIILDLCTSNISTAVGTVEKQKKLQNLNDVLGKKAGNMKASKKSNGKENVSSLVRKKIKKPTEEEAITILHENSEDDSENSQDDKQFRAKREFLMSGLPESLKRQITKKAAALEAYSLANSCFRTVVHVQQKDEGCLMWRLVLPSCPLLTNLREVDSDVTDVAKLTFSLGEFSVLNAQPHSIDSQIIVPSGWRPAFSDAQKNCLLEEIQSCNVHFPVKQFFDLIMKKQAAPEKNKQVSKCEVVNSETSRKTDNRKKAKRKRQTEDHKSRRRKSVENTEIDLPNKVSKVLNVKQGGMENTSHITDTHETEESETLTIEDSDLGSEISAVSDFTHEDILWTEKYQPQNSSELIGNTVAIKKLHRWLCEWKRRADWEEKRNQKEESDSQQESSDSMDFQDDKSDSEDETMLCNTMLLIGPPGIGKTAAVYACAQELGFKIFEVNASCQRSGRQILSHLKEATQSHQVDKQGVHAHKPSFFNSYSSSKSPKKKSPRKEWSPRKSPVSPRKVGLKQGLAPRTLANYFKISSKPPNKENAQGSNKENKETSYGENTQIKSVKGEIKEDESSKKCATSLILFEEVDIIFEEDVGFLNAIKTFMTTTKRPVILTTNDPSFSLIFDGCFEEITFSTPSLINVASYLQVLCLGENLRTDIKDFAALLTSNNCDIRQSILHLQFWVKSGGGYLKEKGLALQGQGKETSHTEQGVCIKEPTTTKIRNPDPLVKIPKCNTGCIENLLGLTNIFLPSEDLFSFLKHEITTKEEWNKLIHLLTEFQRKNIDFIYSNLENILPLPVNILPEPMHVPNLLDKNFTKSSSNNGPNDNDCLRDTSPVKKAKQTKRRRKIVILDDSDLFESELNYSGFITVPSDTNGSCLEEKPECTSTGALNDETTAKAKGCVLTFQCLNSLTEFVDNMSLSDCCFSWRTQASTPPCKYEEFIWTKGKIKNGLSDEFSVEDADWWTSQSSIELKATMEALNFNKCFKNISKIKENALNTARIPRKNELEDVPLHISKDQPNLYFGQPAANSRIQHNAQKRLELIESVFSGRNPLNFSNRQASVMEYLPTLRNICKSEKQKEQGRTKRRFLHYLEGIHLPKEILNTLATDFP